MNCAMTAPRCGEHLPVCADGELRVITFNGGRLHLEVGDERFVLVDVIEKRAISATYSPEHDEIEVVQKFIVDVHQLPEELRLRADEIQEKISALLD